jgi:hypothetical protein
MVDGCKEAEFKGPIMRGAKGFKYNTNEIPDPRIRSRLLRNRVYAKNSKNKKRMEEDKEDRELARLQEENDALLLEAANLRQLLIQAQVSRAFPNVHLQP